jgi:hypothetical protein
LLAGFLLKLLVKCEIYSFMLSGPLSPWYGESSGCGLRMWRTAAKQSWTTDRGWVSMMGVGITNFAVKRQHVI